MLADKNCILIFRTSIIKALNYFVSRPQKMRAPPVIFSIDVSGVRKEFREIYWDIDKQDYAFTLSELHYREDNV